MDDAKRTADMGLGSDYSGKYPNTKLTSAELKIPLFNGYFRVASVDPTDNEYELIVELDHEPHIKYMGAQSVRVIVFCDQVLTLHHVYRGYFDDHPSRNPENLRFIVLEDLVANARERAE